MKRLVLGLPLAMGVVCGAYMIIYLVRWEWNRAIIAGLFFVAVELLFIGLALFDRLRALEVRIEQVAPDGRRVASRPDAVLEAIHDSAPPTHDHFGWLRDQTRTTNVFLPVLLGAGVLASALAWVVEHVARTTLSPMRERRLADSLGMLRPPPEGLLGPTPRPSAPAPALHRVLASGAAVLAVVGVGVATAGAVDFVADRTQTRPDVLTAGVHTVIELELHGAVAAQDPERALGHLWSLCTGPDVFRSRQLPPPRVEDGPHGDFVVWLPTDVGDKSMERLRGCLNDTALDKVQARVLRVAIAAR